MSDLFGNHTTRLICTYICIVCLDQCFERQHGFGPWGNQIIVGLKDAKLNKLIWYVMKTIIVVLISNSWMNSFNPGSLLWDIGKQNSARCDAAERGVPSGAILFARKIE